MNITTTLSLSNEIIWEILPKILDDAEASSLVVEINYNKTEIVPATWYDPEEGGDIEDVYLVEVVGYYGDIDLDNLKPQEVTASQAAAIIAELGDLLEEMVIEELEKI